MKILFVVLFFCVGAFAQESEETGIPYVKTEKAVKHLGVGLSADGDTFYTYANNTLIHWNMNPIKMIDSIKIADPVASSCNFDITPDRKKIIFSHWGLGLGLFDLETKQFVKKIPMRFYGDALVGSKIVTVDKNRKITVRNLENLDVIKTIQIPEEMPECDECSDRPLALLKSKNEKTLVLVTGIRLIAFDSVTMKQMKEIKAWFSTAGGLKISSDHRVLSGHYITFDLNSLQPMTEELKENLDSSVITSLGAIRRWYTTRTDKQYDHSSVNVLFRMKSKKLYQFIDGNWLIITDSGYFDGSPDSRKYLFMKTTPGETVPIDNASYQKFHRKIYLEKITP